MTWPPADLWQLWFDCSRLPNCLVLSCLVAAILQSGGHGAAFSLPRLLTPPHIGFLPELCSTSTVLPTHCLDCLVPRPLIDTYVCKRGERACMHGSDTPYGRAELSSLGGGWHCIVMAAITAPQTNQRGGL
jgi:hypothetical protein